MDGWDFGDGEEISECPSGVDGASRDVSRLAAALELAAAAPELVAAWRSNWPQLRFIRPFFPYFYDRLPRLQQARFV